MKFEGTVLEANLALLFSRAYEPVRSSPEFRERLRSALEREIVPPREIRRFPVWRIAAAILILIGAFLFGWRLFERSSVAQSLEEYLADGRPALRESPEGEWRPLTEDEIRDGVPLASTSAGDPGLEASVPGISERSNAGATEPAAPPKTEPDVPATATLRGNLVFLGGEAAPKEFTVTVLRSERLPEIGSPRTKTFLFEDGQFIWDNLRPGTYSVFVHGQGFASWVKRGVALAADSPVDLHVELDRGVAVRGRVLDPEGRPVENALVLAEEETPSQVLLFALTDIPAEWSAATRTDPLGAFELLHLRPGDKTLRATRAGFGAGWSERLDPSKVDPVEGVEIRLSRSAAIEGSVMHDDGAPWPGAQIVASLLDMTYERPCMSFGFGMAGADGRYAIEDLPPGAYVVLNVSEAHVPSGPASPRIVQVRVEAGSRVQVDIPGTLRGTPLEGKLVWDAAGRPAAGYDVTLCPKGKQDTDWKAARSGADGRFRFPDLAPGVYDVFVGKELGEEFTRQLEIEVPAVPAFSTTIQLASGSIRGKVTDAATGSGLPMSVVVLEIEHESKLEFAAKTLSDKDGLYGFDHVPPGRYRATAYATTGRYGQEVVDVVEILERGGPTSLDFSMHPGAELVVRVTDSSGRPVQRAEIRFVDASGAAVSFSPDDVTDPNGVLRVNGVKPGRWTVSASHGVRGRASTTVDLSAGEQRTLEFTLPSDD